jgi:hypothetical protein
MDAKIPKANAAPSVLVKVAVWVMKPGPMAEVAIRKTAAINEARRDPMRWSVSAGSKPRPARTFRALTVR